MNKAKKILLIMMTVASMFALVCFNVSAAETMLDGRPAYISGDYMYFINDDDTVGVYRYLNKDCGYVVIPREIDGKKVTVMSGDRTVGVLYSRTEMKTLVIPNTVKEINHFAVQSCYSLNKLDIPDSVKVIKEGAFCDNSFEALAIGKGIKTIESGVFSGTFIENIYYAGSKSDWKKVDKGEDSEDEWKNMWLKEAKIHYNHKHKAKSSKTIEKATYNSTGYKVSVCKTCGCSYGEDIPVKELPATKKLTGKAASTTSVKISWSKVAEADGYNVYQYNSNTKKWKKIKTTTSRSYTVKKLKSATKYKFKVTAYIKNGKKTVAGKDSKALTVSTKPSATKLSSLTAGKKSITVKWKKVSGVTGYSLEYSTKKDFSSKKAVTVKKASTVKKTVKSLKSGKTYYVRVRAYKAVGETKVYGAYSSVKSIKVK